MKHLFTFGDSVLDCAAYSGPPDPGTIVAKALGMQLHHFAQDGATSADLMGQLDFAERAAPLDPIDIALLSIGGNDLLRNDYSDAMVLRFATRLTWFMTNLPASRLFVATIYDPTFGKDQFAPFIEPQDGPAARAAFNAMNEAIRTNVTIDRRATLVDLHALFAKGSPDWYTNLIEPSRIGADKIAEAFLTAIRS